MPARRTRVRSVGHRHQPAVRLSGRLHRLHPGKTEVRIFDYVDRQVPVLLRMFERRLRGYPSIGYARGEAPLGLAEDAGGVSVDADSMEAAPAEGDVSD